jgi:hypothetical protein
MADEALSVAFLEGRRGIVHSYDSFGRAVAEIMIQEARRMILARETEATPAAIEFKANVIVAAVGQTGHLGVEVCVPSIGCSKVHVPKTS